MTVTPCPSNPLGIKGCGEAGAIAAPAAVINAITDALGHEDIAMPATPAGGVARGAAGARPDGGERSPTSSGCRVATEDADDGSTEESDVRLRHITARQACARRRSLLAKIEEAKFLAGGHTLLADDEAAPRGAAGT